MKPPLYIRVITVRSIDHAYPTAGDWDWTDNDLFVAVTKQKNVKRTFLLAMHELLEAFFCKMAGITTDDVTEWDVMYEYNRKRGDNSEPGDDPKAPYHKQHKSAERIEKLIAQELGVDFETYVKGIL